MNESEAQTYVDLLLDTVPDSPAPIAGLVAAGARARRRRTRRTALAAAGAVAVVAVGGAIVSGPVGDEPGPAEPTPTTTTTPTPTPTPSTLAPPPGTSYVGVGRLVVALPNRSWVDQQCLISDGSLLTTRSLPCGASYPANSVPEQVTFWASDSRKGAQVRQLTLRDRDIDGLDVQVDHDGGICQTTPNGPCFVDVIVPSESLVVSIRARDSGRLAEIRDSLALLPGGFTTVPSFGDLEPYDAVAARLAGSGLVTEPVGAQEAYVESLDPQPGTPIAEGEPVRVSTTPYRKGPPTG